MFSLLRRRPLKRRTRVIEDDIRGCAFDMDNQTIPNPVHISNRQGNNPVIGVLANEIACPVQFGIINASSWHLNDDDRAVQVKRNKGTRPSVSDICRKPGNTGVPVLPLVADSCPPGHNNPAPENKPYKHNACAKKKIRHKGTCTFLLYKNMLLRSWFGDTPACGVCAGTPGNSLRASGLLRYLFSHARSSSLQSERLLHPR